MAGRKKKTPSAPTPQALRERVTRMTHQGLRIQAIKDLRRRTGLNLKVSRTVTDPMAMRWRWGMTYRAIPSWPGFSPSAT